jgi:CheY-like chemotaxis protein
MTTILVIDDDAHMRQFMRRVLESSGYTVTEAANGRAGVERFRAEPADVVVTDMVMPEQGGIETMLQLKSAHPKVRIVGVTGSGAGAQLSLVRSAGRLGADVWLAKPFLANELLRAIAEVLAGKDGRAN